MKLFTVRARVLTPTIIVRKTHVEGRVWSTETTMIPGSTIRGSLLTELMKRNGSDEANNEALKGLFTVTPLYHTNAPSSSPVIPAHALASKLKMHPELTEPVISAGVKDVAESIRSGKQTRDAVREALIKAVRMRLEEYVRGAKWHAPGTDKACMSEPTARVGEKEALYAAQGEAETTHYTQVAIDHASGGAVHGMLYTYELVRPGEEFQGYLAFNEESKLKEIIRDGESLKTVVGRGGSRGYGLVSLEFRETSLERELEKILGCKLSETSEELKKGGVIPLMCLSPFRLVPGNPSSPLEPWVPKKIEVPSTHAKKLGYDGPSATLELVSEPLGSTMIVRGWSVRDNAPKMPVKSLRPGSILFYKLESDPSSTPEALASLLLGLDYDSSLGFNHLIPLLEDPYPTVIPHEKR